jgi:acyl-coenzyme A thioesterase PaaI-like protein
VDFILIEPGLINYHLKINANHLTTPNSAHGGLIASLVVAELG